MNSISLRKKPNVTMTGRSSPVFAAEKNLAEGRPVWYNESRNDSRGCGVNQ